MAYRKSKTLAKSFGPCQPARTAQADMGRYFFANAISQLYIEHYIFVRKTPEKRRNVHWSPQQERNNVKDGAKQHTDKQTSWWQLFASCSGEI